jgi:site-specific recombinase XerD
MKLLDQLRQALRTKHYAYRTEQCYVRWTVQYLRFHKRCDEWRHPSTLGATDIEQFLTALALQRHVSASTQNQTLSALVFLYRDVLHLEVGDFAAVRARRPKRVPLALSPAEVRALLAALDALPTM